MVNRNLIKLGSLLVISQYLVQFAFLPFVAVVVLKKQDRKKIFIFWMRIYLKTYAVYAVELASGDFAVMRVYLSSCILL